MVFRKVRYIDLYYSYYVLLIDQTYNILVILNFFADDTTIAFYNTNISFLENSIKDTLVLIHERLYNNRLHLNIEKLYLIVYYLTGHGLNIKYI